MSLPMLVAAAFGMAGLAPLLTRLLGRLAGYPLAGLFALLALAVAREAPEVLAGQPVQDSLPWLPSAGLELALRLDGLAMLFALLILGIGALVLAYSARYLSATGRHGRLYSLLIAFAASMLGLVLADNLIVLFVFWELTSVTSFLLIGGRGEGRRAATRALLTTSMGGLGLLAGLVLLGVAAGTTSLSAILASPAAVHAHALGPVIMWLIIFGAFTKSAQLPFHFWLPGAMVAPTPVSTYLHAATMVKAGVYLLMRMSPVYAGVGQWRAALVLVGLATAAWGALLALKQHDLKALLAYSTVSQLGLLTALVGVGTVAALAAAALHTIAHALYKSSLFMIVGIIDHEAGSRDIRELSGLGRMMPITATVTALAALSMAGLLPLLGFVSKEEAFAAFLGAEGAAWFAPLAAALAVGASAMTFAYGARIFSAFEGPIRQPLYEPALPFVAPAAIAAFGGLALGPAVALLDPLVSAAAASSMGTPIESAQLALWHGLSPALGLSLVTIAIGTGLFAARRGLDRLLQPRRVPLDGARAFDEAYSGAMALGRWVGAPAASSAPAVHMAPVLLALAALGAVAWTWAGLDIVGTAPASLPGDWLVVALLGMAALGAALSRRRLAGVALLGMAGFLIAVWYALLGAPDLALTQLLVETLTVVIIVLVFRRLPRLFDPVSARRRAAAAVTAALVGGLAGVGAYQLTGRRELSAAGAWFLESAEPQAGGANVVNVILVDFRALDTLGEVTVLAVAALGIAGLVRLGRRARQQ